MVNDIVIINRKMIYSLLRELFSGTLTRTDYCDMFVLISRTGQPLVEFLPCFIASPNS